MRGLTACADFYVVVLERCPRCHYYRASSAGEPKPPYPCTVGRMNDATFWIPATIALAVKSRIGTKGVVGLFEHRCTDNVGSAAIPGELPRAILEHDGYKCVCHGVLRMIVGTAALGAIRPVVVKMVRYIAAKQCRPSLFVYLDNTVGFAVD